ncbi:MAG: alkaline phosphatase family protein [Myxococcales bacterium]|nr:alkaline phosphatase family protein [Myxococcales bacterium]
MAGSPRIARTPWAVIAAIVLVVVGAIGAVRAALTGADFMYDLEQPRSALARTPPVVIDPATPRLAQRVLLIIVDGLRWDASRRMPSLDRLRGRGVDGHATSHYPSWSRPNYVSILTGVSPQASGVRTNRHYSPVALDTLMDRAQAAHVRSAAASDNSPLPALFLRPLDPARLAELDELDIDAMDDRDSEEARAAAGMEVRSPFDDARYAPWPGGVVEAARAQLADGAALEVVLIGVVDDAGHAEGAASDEYAAAVATADRMVARIVAAVDLDRDAVIVIADHGHTDRGGHGGVEPEVMTVPLVAAGAGIRAGAAPRDARLIDVAPTVAALLAMPAPGHGLGRTLTELLTLDPAAAAARTAADDARRATTTRVVADSRSTSLARALARRGLRLGGVAGLALALVAVALWLRRRGGLWFDRRTLVLGMPAFFVVYYVMVAAMGQRFSPSFLPAKGDLAFELAKYGVLGALAHVAIGWMVLRRHRSLAERLALANGNAAVGLFLTMVPALLLWALFPPPYTEVPGPRMLVIIPSLQVAVALYAFAILLSLAIEVVVFFARALDPSTRLIRLERATALARKQLEAAIPRAGDRDEPPAA